MSSSSRAAFLRRVPVLSGLDDELLSRLASEVTEAEIRAGEWLMRQGDEGDSLYGSEAEVPRLAETIVRTVTVGSADTAEAARRHADLVIQPEVDGVGLLDWRQLEPIREAGRAAARSALEANPDWLGRPGPEGPSRNSAVPGAEGAGAEVRA